MYQHRFEDIVFEALPDDADSVGVSGDDVAGPVGFDFPIHFFGQTHAEFHVSTNGFVTPDLTITNSHHSNHQLPSSSTPHGMVAVWWDDSECASGQIRKMTVGQAPTRTQIVEWTNCVTWSGGHAWQAQIHFFESGTAIETHYGPAAITTSGTATVGLESIAQTTADTVLPLSCNPSCTFQDFPTDQKIVYETAPNLAVLSVEAPEVSWGGVNTRIVATVINRGGRLAEDVDVSFRLSVDEVVDDEDWYVGTTNEEISLDFNSLAQLAIEAPLPRDIPPGTYYLIADVDPEGLVDELDENDNQLVVGAFVVGEPTPDLTVATIASPVTVEPGVPFDLVWTARNIGNLDVVDGTYSVIVSQDSILSSIDPTVAVGQLVIPEFSEQEETIQVTIPIEFPPGNYWLGVVIDPDDEILEIDESNNSALANEPFLLASNTVEILTTALPPTALGAPYCKGLQAAGGDGIHSWSVISGALPLGMELDELYIGGRLGATRLCGEASALGTFTFTLQVESNGATDTRTFDLVVEDSITDVMIVTDTLAPAMVMESYPQALSAVGGVPPYEWQVVGGMLPVGVGLDKAGRFFGRAREEGLFSLTVEVQDREGQTARQEYELPVDPSQAVRCLTETLPDHELGQEFNLQLRASGGNPPYTWKNLESRRLPTGLDAGKAWVSQAPAGLHLGADGTVVGVPQSVGSYFWQVEVGSEDSTQTSRCGITFRVTHDEGLVITTQTLQEAYAGERYEVELRAVGGEPPLTWSLLPGSQLPEGFELADDGTLSGAFDRDALAGAKAVETTFSVRVQDFHHRVATTSFRLGQLAERPTWDVVVDKPRTESNCQVAGGAPGLLGWLAVLGLAALHRRRE